VDSLTQEAYLCKQKDMTRMAVVVAMADLTNIQHQLKEVAPHSKRESPTSSFKLVEDTTMIEVDLESLARLSALGPGYLRGLKPPSWSFCAASTTPVERG